MAANDPPRAVPRAPAPRRRHSADVVPQEVLPSWPTGCPVLFCAANPAGTAFNRPKASSHPGVESFTMMSILLEVGAGQGARPVRCLLREVHDREATHPAS